MSAIGNEYSAVGLTAPRQELTVADLDDVVRIENLSFPEPWSSSELKMAICDPSAICLGSRQDEKLIGFGIAYLEEATLHLATLAIVPSQRGRGRGSSLLRGVLRYAGQRGCDRCTLEVRRSNQAARRLYGRHGFKADDIRWDYYPNPRDHAVLMSRSL